MERIPTIFENEAMRMSALNKHKHKHMNSNEKSAGAAFLIVIGTFALLSLLWLYGIFAYGFVITKLWVWFVMTVPAFGIDYKLGILQAAGLFMFVRFFTHNHNVKINSQDERPVTDKIAEVFVPILIPWATLLLAWLLKGMM